MNRIFRFFTIAFIFIALAHIFSPPASAVIQYQSGYYTNLCGSGTRDAATADLCNKGCSPGAGQCTADQPYVVKWTCDGNQIECRGNETEFTTSQSVAGTGCGKTVQLDVFKRKCRNFLGWVCDQNDLLDFMVWYSGDCPNTPITPSPTNTPTPISATSSCNQLRVTSGNGGLVPALITLRATGADSSGSIQRYRFYFGDGQTNESTNPEIQHRYEVSGTFLARADILDSRGIWKTSDSCQTPVSVQSLPVESQKSDCSDLFIVSGNSTGVPATGKFLVSGYDNKGSVKRYKMDFGNGITRESDSNTFEQVYNTAGTYTVRGFIQDTQSSWKSGTGSCEKPFYVATKPLASQPETGTPTVFTLAALTSGIVGISLLASKSLQASVRPATRSKSKRRRSR